MTCSACDLFKSVLIKGNSFVTLTNCIYARISVNLFFSGRDCKVFFVSCSQKPKLIHRSRLTIGKLSAILEEIYPIILNAIALYLNNEIVPSLVPFDQIIISGGGDEDDVQLISPKDTIATRVKRRRGLYFAVALP